MIEFDPDTAEAVELLWREGGRGLSEAVNELIRRGLRADQRQTPYRPIHRDLGLKIDASNVTDALDPLEGHGDAGSSSARQLIAAPCDGRSDAEVHC